MSSGEVWRKVRRFAVQTMRDFGMGKKKVWTYDRFQEPLEFRPEKFVDVKSGKVINRDILIPFSIGNKILNLWLQKF